MPHVITWNGILTARDNGVQVWSDQINSRDMHSMFSNERCSANTLMPMLHDFHLELWGDQFLTLELISLNCKALSINKTEESSNLQQTTMQLDFRRRKIPQTKFFMPFQHGCDNVSGGANKNVSWLAEGVIDVTFSINCARDAIDLILSNWCALTKPNEDDALLIFVAWLVPSDNVFSITNTAPASMTPIVWCMLDLLAPVRWTSKVAAGLFGLHLIEMTWEITFSWKGWGVRCQTHSIDCVSMRSKSFTLLLYSFF